jgi:hypothetical protein
MRADFHQGAVRESKAEFLATARRIQTRAVPLTTRLKISYNDPARAVNDDRSPLVRGALLNGSVSSPLLPDLRVAAVRCNDPG